MFQRILKTMLPILVAVAVTAHLAAWGAEAKPAAAPAPQAASAATWPPRHRAAPASAPAGLDGRIQDVKGDVIRLNRDLMVLEEELLFPANTQVALFVSMDVGKLFELDSVQIKLDDKVVANYLYTPLEVQALHRGGVQRVYLGNLRAGEHQIVAFFTGKGPHDARLQARRHDQVRQGHRAEVHRAAHQGFDRQAAAGVRRQGLAVTAHALERPPSQVAAAPRRRGGHRVGLLGRVGARGRARPEAGRQGPALRRHAVPLLPVALLLVGDEPDGVAALQPRGPACRRGRGAARRLAAVVRPAPRGRRDLRPADRTRRAAAGARPRLVLPGQDPLPARLHRRGRGRDRAASRSTCRPIWRKTACCCRPTC